MSIADRPLSPAEEAAQGHGFTRQDRTNAPTPKSPDRAQGGAGTPETMAEAGRRHFSATCSQFREHHDSLWDECSPDLKAFHAKMEVEFDAAGIELRPKPTRAEFDVIRARSPAVAPRVPDGVVPGIYMASKAVHGPRWRELRDAGCPIISTWIDEAEAGLTKDWADLWDRCAAEPAQAAVTVLYAEDGETLKGALAEVGAALSHGRRVIVVGPVEHTWTKHRNVITTPNIDTGMSIAMLEVERAKAALILTPADDVARLVALEQENVVLRAALSALPGIAEECRVKWDAGMKAGKLLIALTDPTLRYRTDITELHRAAAILTKREVALATELDAARALIADRDAAVESARAAAFREAAQLATDQANEDRRLLKDGMIDHEPAAAAILTSVNIAKTISALSAATKQEAGDAGSGRADGEVRT